MTPAVRVYRWLIRLLPRAVRERDGDEMAHAFAEQIAGSQNPAAVTWRAFRRFHVVLALEWRDAFIARRLPAQPVRPRRGLMDAVMRMVRQGSRSLIRTPAFAFSVVLLLGLGVGSASAIFAVVDHVLLRRMPYPSAERLFVVENGSHSVPMFQDLQSMRSVEAWSAATSEQANLTGEGEPLQVREATVTDGFFPMFGATAHAGRLLQADDFQRAQAVVLSYGLWLRAFGGDTGVVGRTIRVNDRALTVVGVLDGNFAIPEAIVDANVDLWRPLDRDAPYMTNRNYWAFGVAGRLHASATLRQAEQDAAKVAADRARAFPNVYTEHGKASPLPVRSLQEATTGDAKHGLTLLFGAVTLLLLVACANVTLLFLARGVARTREIAVRRALGATTRSLVGQLFTESLLLGAAGALAGIAFAQGGVRAFLALMPEGLPRAGAIGVDGRVLLFAAAIGIATAVVFGLFPALRFTRATIGNPLRSAGRGITGGRAAQAFRNTVVIGEVALSLVLVAQAGWLLRSFIRMTHQELGFQTKGVITMPMSVTGIENPAQWYARMDVIRESLARVPGVEKAAFGLTMPLEWAGGGRCCWGQRADFAGKGKAARPSMYHPVSDDYFSLLGLRMIAGRPWTRAHASALPIPAVISEDLAVRTFGTASAALGATFTTSNKTFEVIGVAANNRHYGADQDYGTAVYLPANAIPFSPGRVHMAVLTQRTDGQVQRDLRAAIWQAEPKLPVPTIRSLDDWSRAASAQRRFDSVLFAVFSAVALMLVAAGLAGTLFYMVSLQRRDLGIRLALGETPRGIERRVLTRGVGMAAIGVLIGTGGAWMSGRLLEARLFGVEARDFRTLGFSVAVLMAIALLSSWVPARRAAGTNPMESMRSDW